MDVCTICSEEIQEDSERFQLECNHVFHAKCIATAFRHNPKCPNCRHLPENINRDDDSDSASSASSDEDSGITLEEAIRIARHSNPNKALKRQFQTLRQWKVRSKNLRQQTKEISKDIDKGHNDIDEKTEAFRTRLITHFKKKNKQKISQLIALERQLAISLRNEKATERRIASKYGYGS